MKVDVILPIYNPNEWVLEAIESIQAQTYSDWHLYIVDDCSPLPNRYVEEVEKRCADSEKMTYMRLEKNMRAAEARNIAISKSTGDLIGLIDQDDKWRHDKLELVVGYISQHPDVSLVHSNIVGMNSSGEQDPSLFGKENERRERVDYSVTDRMALLKEIVKRELPRIGTIVVKRECFFESGGFAGNLFGPEDPLFLVNALSTHNVGFLPDGLIYRRVHTKNVSLTHLRPRALATMAAYVELGQKYPFLKYELLAHERYLSYYLCRGYLQRWDWSMAFQQALELVTRNVWDFKRWGMLVLLGFVSFPLSLVRGRKES